jgi:hypothetical protein
VSAETSVGHPREDEEEEEEEEEESTHWIRGSHQDRSLARIGECCVSRGGSRRTSRQGTL